MRGGAPRGGEMSSTRSTRLNDRQLLNQPDSMIGGKFNVGNINFYANKGS